MKVGDTLYLFDSNRRVYRKKKPGEAYASGGPIWREHWAPHVISGETRVSWIIDDYSRKGRRVPKTGGFGIAFSVEEVDRLAWINDNARRIADAVATCRDYSKLQRVAELIGYRPPPSPEREP